MIPSLANDSGGVIALVVTIIFTLLCILFVGLRVLAVVQGRRDFKASDYFIFAALAVVIGGAVDAAIGIYYGAVGIDVEYATLSEIMIGLKTLLAGSVLWVVSTALVKFSVVSFYYELFPLPGFRRVVWVMAGLIALFLIGFLIEPFILCNPVSFTWTQVEDPTGGWCGDQFAEEIAAASSNMFIDLLLIALPMPVIWRLKMTLMRKFQISAIFSLGFAITGVNIARIIVTVYADPENPTFFEAEAFILAQMEVWLGIIVACLPLLRSLTIFGHGKSSSRSFSSSIRSKVRVLTSRLSGNSTAHSSDSATGKSYETVGLDTSSSSQDAGTDKVV